MTISTQQIIDRLNAQRIVESGAVAAVDELQSAPKAISGFVTTPMCLVEVPSEIAKESDAGTGLTSNPTAILIRIYLIFTGVITNADIERARDTVKTALIGWTPDSANYDPVNPVGAIVLEQDMQTGFLNLLCTFSSHYTQRTP